MFKVQKKETAIYFYRAQLCQSAIDRGGVSVRHTLVLIQN